MSAWKDYRIGNGLRGYFGYKARSTQEAWERGCKILNRALPSRKGRVVFMQIKAEPIPLTVTPYIIKQVGLPDNEKDVFRFKELPTREWVGDWITLVYGLSTQKKLI